MFKPFLTTRTNSKATNRLEFFSGFLVCGHFGSLPSVLLFDPVQFSTSLNPAARMEPPLQPQYGPPFEPLGFSLEHGPESPSRLDPESCTNDHEDYLHGSQSFPSGNSIGNRVGSSATINSSAQEEVECLIDSQPICFEENPFLVANRRGKGRPSGQQILSGPPVGYGKQGQLQPWLYSKASSLAGGGVWGQHGVSEHTRLMFDSLHCAPSFQLRLWGRFLI